MLIYQISLKLYTANSGINFFLYCISGHKFRKDLKEILFCSGIANRAITRGRSQSNTAYSKTCSIAALVPFLHSNCKPDSNVQGKRHICEKLLVCYKYLHFLPCNTKTGQQCRFESLVFICNVPEHLRYRNSKHTVLIFMSNLFTDAKYLIPPLFLKINII